jgi:hypothetical protein
VLAGIRSHLTYANVASSLALFIAISGGAAFAVTQLDANSVKSKHIVNGQVKAPDLVPSDPHDSGLTVKADMDNICVSGAWYTRASRVAAYYRDPLGEVHLTGAIDPCGDPPDQVFALPEGFRPAADDVDLPVSVIGGGGRLTVDQDGTVSVPGADPSMGAIALNGISFRCGPSGQNGCP